MERSAVQGQLRVNLGEPGDCFDPASNIDEKSALTGDKLRKRQQLYR